MDALIIIIFGFIGYWDYYTVKHEGVIWIIRTTSVLGRFVSFIWMIFKTVNQVQLYGLFFLAMSSGAVLSIINCRIFMFCENEIKKRVGSDSYKNENK